MASVYDVANFFIDTANKSEDDSVSNLKLNKLLYFAQGAFLARTGRKLFQDSIYACEYGPVIPGIYRKYSSYEKRPIETVDESYNANSFTEEELTVLIDVMREMGQYTGSKLVSLTHLPNTPWSSVHEKGKQNLIDTSSMKEYFTRNPIKEYSLPNGIEHVKALPNEWYDPSEDDEWKAYLK